MTQLVYLLKAGRLGNQMIRFAHFIAWNIEHENKVQLVNVNFWEYAGLFKYWANNKVCIYPKNKNIFWRCIRVVYDLNIFGKRSHRFIRYFHYLIHRLAKILPFTQSISTDCVTRFSDVYLGPITLEDGELYQKVCKKPLTFLGGWNIQGWDLLKKHQAKVREYFVPTPEIEDKVSQFIQDSREGYDLLIGILVRQDDYRNWKGGVYFFETERYVEWMEEIKNIFSDKKVKFVVASDEEQNPEKFKDLNYDFSTGEKVGKGHYFENIIALSKCDFIASVPSTFSSIAGFLGNVPIIPLVDKNKKILKEDIMNNHIFDVIHHDHFSVSVK